MKKLSIFLLALVASAGITQAAIIDGSCGDNLIWSLNTKDSTLTITGSGEMTSRPWSDYNSYIKYVFLPDGLTSIGEYAFYSCDALTSVTIPSGVTSIGNYAFFLCSSLTSVVIPNGVTRIGNYAFAHCSSLTAATIPNSVTSIGDWIFGDCPLLESINVTDNPYYYSIEGVLFNKEMTKVIQYPAGKQGAFTIPNSVTSIANGAFIHCAGLTSVTIPNSVTNIGEYAFSSCTGLTSVEIPNSVTSIGNWAFSDCNGLISVAIPNSVTITGKRIFSFCTALTSVTIPNSVTSIGEGEFAYCKGLISITIPNSVTSIGDEAFYNCSGLTSLINYATTPQVITSDVFGGNSYSPAVNKSTCTLYVPEESVDAYKTADVWKEFANIVAVKEPIEMIEGDYTINYVDKESQELCNEVVTLHVPEAPFITGFTFVGWQASGMLADGITLKAVYQPDVPASAPAVYTNPTNPAQKLIRNGNVYILTEDKTYTITGLQVK